MRLDQAIARARPLKIDLSESDLRERVTKALSNLRQSVLAETDVMRAKSAIKKHIGRLILTPVVKDGRRVYRVSGAINVSDAKGVMQLVARDGIEPPTPAFSGLLIDSEKLFILNESC